MPYEFYLSFKGSKQGQFKPETQKTRGTDKWSEVIAFKMGTEVPVDAKSGGPKGGRTHKPIVITREVDGASPGLFQLCVTGETLTEVVLETVFCGHTAKRITLRDAVLARVGPSLALPRKPSRGRGKFQWEDLSFVFGSILIENLAASTSTTDDVTANSQ